MGLAPARVGGMAEKGWVAPPAKACGNFRAVRDVTDVLRQQKLTPVLGLDQEEHPAGFTLAAKTA